MVNDFSGHSQCPRIKNSETYQFPVEKDGTYNFILEHGMNPFYLQNPGPEVVKLNPFFSYPCSECSKLLTKPGLDTNAGKKGICLIRIDECREYGGLRAGVGLNENMEISLTAEQLKKLLKERSRIAYSPMTGKRHIP